MDAPSRRPQSHTCLRLREPLLPWTQTRRASGLLPPACPHAVGPSPCGVDGTSRSQSLQPLQTLNVDSYQSQVMAYNAGVERSNSVWQRDRDSARPGRQRPGLGVAVGGGAPWWEQHSAHGLFPCAPRALEQSTEGVAVRALKALRELAKRGELWEAHGEARCVVSSPGREAAPGHGQRPQVSSHAGQAAPQQPPLRPAPRTRHCLPSASGPVSESLAEAGGQHAQALFP